jgi:RND family efflux transporter MFP subunit
MPVDLATIATAQVSDFTEYIGTLQSRRSITIQPQVDGQITKILVKSGDVVEAGQPLMQIDSARAQALLTAARASHTARQAALTLGRRDLERTEALVERGVSTGQALDQARASVDVTKAEVDALGAAVRESEVQLTYYRITAPARGVVGDIPVRVGDRVSPATLLTTLDNNDALEVYVSIPVERAPQVHLGTEIQLTDPAGKTVASGQVHFVSPKVNRDTQSILVKAGIVNEAAGLRPDQFVRVRVIWSSHPGVTVPALSVTRLNGQAFVFVAEKKEAGLVASQRPIGLGQLVDNQFVVESGLAAGDQVIVSGIQKLRDGAPVAPAPPPPAKAASASPDKSPAPPAAAKTAEK